VCELLYAELNFYLVLFRTTSYIGSQFVF